MNQIRAILEANNIAGVVVLHEPGFCEFMTRVSPTYSCLSVSNGKFKLHADLIGDFGGNKVAMTQRVSDTMNMMDMLVKGAGSIALNMGQSYKSMMASIDITNE
jgi:hypothetical protein